MKECSFCHSTDYKLLIESSNPDICICNSCIDQARLALIVNSDLKEERIQEVKTKKQKNKIMTPKEIKAFLDRYIVGQEKTKKIISVGIYNHMLKILCNLNVQKSNILLIGPSGSGKTLFAQTLSKILKVPFIIADATTLTEEGYVGCVGQDVEYISETGWKKIKDYNGEKIAQYNHDTKQAEFVYPINYIKLPCNKLTSFKTRYKGLSQVLSDEHNVYYLTSKNNLMKRKFSEIKKIHEKTKWGFKGRFLTTFNSPETNGVNFNEWELRLQVAAIADGHFTKRTKNLNYCVFKLRKDRKIKRLIWILENSKIKYNKSKVDKKGYITITCKTKTDDKEFNENYYKLNQYQLNIVSEECVFWDGNQINQFYTSSEKSADFIQYCFSTTGWRASISKYTRDDRPNVLPEFRVHRTKSIYPTLYNNKDGKIEMKDYIPEDGYKYCFTTQSGMFIARHNKCIFITGNSNVESTLQLLLLSCNFDIEKASKGIIFIDEIDKKAKKSGQNMSITRDVSGEGAQQALLKMIEGSVMDIQPTGNRKHPHGDRLLIDTSNILFIFGGAFNGLSDIIANRLSKNNIGFNSKMSKAERDIDLLSHLEQDDLIQYGLIPELVGRIPIISVLNKLSVDELTHILTDPVDSIIEQYKRLLEVDRVNLNFTDNAIRRIAEIADRKGIGARGLKSVIESLMVDFQFEIERDDTEKDYEITEEMIA